ncbi:hypothetical protein CDAR_568831 [Caerostris darwini]|uniref:Uncharacterized protein n=1 Tax=Caerostris darwini TaxID=1538125 RepID=A0AAV4MFM7_9ARAC|nr:hypothetical protein CDAR_568831 [Caerostris darwini]
MSRSNCMERTFTLPCPSNGSFGGPERMDIDGHALGISLPTHIRPLTIHTAAELTHNEGYKQDCNGFVTQRSFEVKSSFTAKRGVVVWRGGEVCIPLETFPGTSFDHLPKGLANILRLLGMRA